MVRRDTFLLQAIKLLSQRVAVIEPTYNLTACLNPAERELIGYLKAYMVFFPEDKEFNTWLKEKVIPMLVQIGISKWPRTELTDLGLRISNVDEEVEDLGKLEYEATEETEDLRQ